MSNLLLISPSLRLDTYFRHVPRKTCGDGPLKQYPEAVSRGPSASLPSAAQRHLLLGILRTSRSSLEALLTGLTTWHDHMLSDKRLDMGALGGEMKIYTASNLMERVQTKTPQSVAMVTSHKEQIMLQVEYPRFDRPRRPDIGRSGKVDDDAG